MKRFTPFYAVMSMLYAIWFLFNFIAFFISDNENSSSGLWPFTTNSEPLTSCYDITEFLLYTIVPLIPFLIYRYLTFVPEDNLLHHHHHRNRHKQHSFLVAFLDEKIKAETLQQEINKLNGGVQNWKQKDELEHERKIAASTSLKHWMDKKLIIKKYKDLEGNE